MSVLFVCIEGAGLFGPLVPFDDTCEQGGGYETALPRPTSSGLGLT